MIKSEIRSLFKNLLPRIDKTNKWHSNVIDAAISRVLNELYNETFGVDPLTLQRYTKGYGYTTPLTIALEATTGLYYVNHPTQIVSIPDKASGIRRISTPIQGGMTFFPVDPREMDLLLNGSYANTVNSKIGYAVTPTRTEFYNMSGVIFASGIRMDILVPFSVYADTDVVLIPEIEAQPGKQPPETFVNRVLAILGVVQPIDIKDDNADPQAKPNKGQ